MKTLFITLILSSNIFAQQTKVEVKDTIEMRAYNYKDLKGTLNFVEYLNRVADIKNPINNNQITKIKNEQDKQNSN